MAKILIIDTETGGIDPLQHSILSLAGVVWADGLTGPHFEVLISEPIFSVTPKALEINHIDLVEHCQRALPPSQAMQTVQSFLTKNFGDQLSSGEKITLAGHNVGFDIGFMRRLCRLAATDFETLFSHRTLDTAAILRFLSLAGILPDRSFGSTEAFQFFGINLPEKMRHTALGDARATCELLTKLIELTRSHTTDDLRLPAVA
jgi:DNA polymerase-3 subunit epsilon